MVVKFETSALYADVHPCRDLPEPPRRRKQKPLLPALVEDDSEPESYEEKPRRVLPRPAPPRRQHSASPPRRDRLRRALVLPSLSEDEEP